MIDRGFRLEGCNGLGVLLIHGLAGAPPEMKPLARRLHRRGFSVSVPQLAGHGLDHDALMRTGWRDWLDSVRWAYNAFRPTVDTVSVAGVCVGGALGLELAADHPAMRAAVVCSMAFACDGWNMPRWASAAALVPPIARLPVISRLSRAQPYPYGLKDERLRGTVETAPESLLEGSLDRLSMGSLGQMYRLGRHLERIGRRISTPTLILHARSDDVSHPRNAYRLARALGGPAEVRLLNNSYHRLHLDQERGLVADLTANFIDLHSRPASVALEASALS